MEMEEQKQKKVLCVGLVCLDIINVVDKYPEEDTDSRLVYGLLLTLSAYLLLSRISMSSTKKVIF